MNRSEELIACLEGEIAARDARIAELEAAQDEVFLRLTNAWITDSGSQMPWGKMIEMTAIITKMPDAERDRLLMLDFPDVLADRDQLRAELAALREQVPVADCYQKGALAEHTNYIRRRTTVEAVEYMWAKGWRIYTAPVTKHAAMPDGYKLVPVEPTPAMIQAGINTDLSETTEEADDYRNVYAAMLAAAPAPGDSQ
jgi:hypothetical protein